MRQVFPCRHYLHSVHMHASQNLHVVHLPHCLRCGNMHLMNLRRIREARGLKQEHLAEMIGVNTSTISRAESMHPSAKLETYQKCAEALNLKLSDLFTDE